ncbi:MAG TPA: hypothetical protein VF303_00315 [Candidatus Nanoarchaeia archaeon]
MPKSSPQTDPSHIPDVVYVSQMKMKPNNVLVGLLIGAVVIAIGVVVAYFILNLAQSEATPVPAVEIKKATPSAKIATPSSQKEDKSTDEDETSDWRKFKGELDGIIFSFKYPKNYKLDSKLQGEKETLLVGTSKTLKGILTEEDVLATIYVSSVSSPTESSEYNSSFAGLDAKEIDDGESLHYFVNNQSPIGPNQVFTFSCVRSPFSLAETCEQIAGSFRFLE